MEGTPKIVEQVDKEKSLDELIEFRLNQSRSSRLAEYITGLRPDDPQMPERLAEDHEIIRNKYGLGDRKMSFKNPEEYERILRNRAEELGVKIKSKSECGSFFEDNGFAGGVYMESERTIGTSMDKSDRLSYFKSLGILEHEFIHAIQHVQSQRMPIELMEYEAYVAGFNIDAIKEKPSSIEFVVFTFFIGGSVNFWYRNKNENSNDVKSRNNPVWDNAEYFLRNVDKVDEEVIKNALLKQKETVEREYLV